MTELLYLNENLGGGCYTKLRLASGEPCVISVSQKGAFVKKSRFGYFGTMLYYQAGVYEVIRLAEALDRRFPIKTIPNTLKNPVFISLTVAVWRCSNADEARFLLYEVSCGAKK